MSRGYRVAPLRERRCGREFKTSGALALGDGKGLGKARRSRISGNHPALQSVQFRFVEALTVARDNGKRLIERADPSLI
ncbi:hypothetical protein [Azospirillum canadense]|uniref:hypothetical protein n=1 Tax=Azospirillum canadense TaxID=403962 RepID=UPI002226D490|nr:hypothetical protein [Azospirillum canadense]MCW2239549.1 hypothetical protein [Azospirillum canadense]